MLLYYSVIPANTPAPSADQIIAGVGVANGSVTDPGLINYTFLAASGLTNGVLYRVAYVLADGPVRSQVTLGPLFVGASDSSYRLKIWNGSSWIASPAKVWSGSWVIKPVKVWNGSAWV